MKADVSVRELAQKEMSGALDLVWRVFREFEAPDYTKEGVKEFYRSIHDADYLAQLCAYGAFSDGGLLGVIATRSGGRHIALFFVDGRYHRQGIGKRLFMAAREVCRSDTMTVNSSPYAIPVYHRLGFHDVEAEKVVNGLRFTPMELEL